MDTFDLLKKDIAGIITGIRKLLGKAGGVSGFSDNNFENWERMIGSIETQISEEIIRVAVVGPIKSGKSTFVNSIYRGDYLKRGAGVVTSIVTRIRSGTGVKASLFFKTWDEINADIRDALVLFPLSTPSSDFDIRRSQDRQQLKDAFNALDPEQLIVNNSRDTNSLLLSFYLEGYDRVSELGLSSESVTIEYKGESFQEHKEFVGNDAMAVYLKDIELEIRSDLDDGNIEIADCQGSDSPNPLHLAMIQDYLLQTHFIIYVISSRTGLRQADIRFLSMIKKMGIMENIMFVVNCDFTEHDNIADLKFLVEKISHEISLIKPDPDLFVFSSLFNLFKEKEPDLAEKETARLELWKNEKEMSRFSDEETRQFYESFNAKIREERYQLLLKNHVERLRLIIAGIEKWAEVSSRIITGDSDAVEETMRKVDLQQQKMQKITSLIRNTLDGGKREIQRELRKDVDSFFSQRPGSILDSIIEFIRAYSVTFDQYEASLASSGFTQTLYAVYQEFRRNLNAYMAETINPGIVGFIKEEEEKITAALGSIAEPFSHMVADAVHEFNTTVSNFDGDASREALDISTDAPDIEAVKGTFGLKLTPATAVMKYSARIKTEAVLKLGFYSVLNLFRRVLKKPVQDKKEDAKLALKDGMRRMKRETERSIVFHFKNYRENIKFQYIFKLADAVSNRYYDVLTEQFQTYITELTSLITLVNQKRIDKEQLFNILKEIDSDLEDINIKLVKIKEKMIAP